MLHKNGIVINLRLVDIIEGYPIQGEQPLDLGPNYVAVRPAKVEGMCFKTGEQEYTVTGTMEFEFKGQCVLCLKDSQKNITVSFNEVFKNEVNEYEDEEYALDGSRLWLYKALNDSAFINLPFSIKCSEDCKGLCQICGHDLNESSCDCESLEYNPFAVLKQLDLPKED